ncbi:MAG: SDR family oxidoreductase [Dehalococcoidia bacterium]|nr:SDR family oxidoreductase [Dehalococcoidia bacterium]
MGDLLKGKVAAVTGGGGGIGRTICLLLAEEGAKVVVNDLGGSVGGEGASRGPAEDVANEVKKRGGQAVPNFQSVSTVAGGESITQDAVKNFGRLDILVHTAGILRDRMIFNMSEQEWDAVIAVHLKGMYCVSRPASMVFRQQRSGRLIGFSSTSGLYGNVGQSNYGAAKEGIAGFIRTAARDLGKYGVTANAIAPTAATRMTANLPDAAKEAKAKAGIKSNVGDADFKGGKGLEPEAIAPFVAFLASDEAANVNGQMFHVQGGEITLLNNPYLLRTMQKAGRWTAQEIHEIGSRTIFMDLRNPAPPASAAPGKG